MCRILKLGRFFLSVSGSPEDLSFFPYLSCFLSCAVHGLGRMADCGSVDVKSKVRRPRKDFSANFARIQHDKNAK